MATATPSRGPGNVAGSGLEALLRWQWFPGGLQALFTVVLVAVAYFSLQPTRRAETNPATAILWLLWWPLLPLTVLFAGRLWCALCPAGALGDWVQAVFSGARSMAPAWTQRLGAWSALAGMVVTGLAFLALGLETNGALTALFLALVTVGAVALALFFRGRVWCRWFCPLGLMLGLYSRVGWLEIGPGTAGIRASARTARACPQFTSPVSRQRRHDCILCGQCLKQGGDTVRLSCDLSPGGAPRPPSLTLIQALGVNLLLGLLMVDSLRMTPLFTDYMTWALSYLSSYRLALTLGGLALLGLVLGSQVGYARVVARRGDRGRLFRQLSMALIPLALALHLALSAQHLVAGGPGVLQGIGAEMGFLASGHMPPADAYSTSLPLKSFQLLLLALGAAGVAHYSARGKLALGRGARLMVSATPGLMQGLIFLQPMSAAC